MASLILNGNTSGSVTISSPAVSGTTTLTLPTTSGTVLTNGTNTNFPAGSVLQVVQGTYTTQISLSSPASGTITATGLTASITPKSSSSKILIMTSNQAWFQNTSTALYGHYIIYRNTSTGIFVEGAADQVIATSEFGVRTNIIYLDSPTTTSSTSYSVSFVNDMQPTNLVLNRNSTPAVIILMEIAA